MNRKNVIVALIAVEVVVLYAAIGALRSSGQIAADFTPRTVAAIDGRLDGAKRVAITVRDTVIELVPAQADASSVTITEKKPGRIVAWGWVNGKFIGNGHESRPPIRFERSGDELRVIRDGTHTVGLWISTDDPVVSIAVPIGLPIDVQEASGVRAAHLRGTLALRSRNGRISVEDHNGDLDLRSDNASVSVSHFTSNTVSIESRNGNVVVEAGRANSMQFSAANGRVTARELDFTGVTPQFSAQSRNGRVDIGVKHLAADGRYSGSSANGSVRLHLPADSDATVVAQTSNGAIKGDGVTFSHDSDGERTARLGDGRAAIRLTSRNGNITLTKESQ